MKYKIPHSLYIILLLISIAITALTFFIKDLAWSTVVASVGAGGIASVGVAWLLDYRKTKIQAIENKARHEELMEPSLESVGRKSSSGQRNRQPAASKHNH